MARARDVTFEDVNVSTNVMTIVRPPGTNGTAIARAVVRCTLACESCHAETPVTVDVAAGGQAFSGGGATGIHDDDPAALRAAADSRAREGLNTELEIMLAWRRCPRCGARGTLATIPARSWIALAVSTLLASLLPVSLTTEAPWPPLAVVLGLAGTAIMVAIVAAPFGVALAAKRKVRLR